MASLAGQNVARVMTPSRAVLVALLFGLAACGDNAATTAENVEAQNSLQQGSRGSAATTGASDPAGGPAAGMPVGDLDTTTWVLAPPFYAAGDEPFWRMEIVEGWFSFRRSGLRAIDEPLVQPRNEAGADIFETGSLLVTIRREACSTEQGGASEFSASVSFDGQDYDGCASGGQVSIASAEAATVTEQLAPIDTCLAKLGQPALATAVYPRQDGEQIAVGLRAKNGALYECVTQGGGAEVVSLDPIEQGSQPAWMNRMRFLREGVATTATCADVEEVRVGEQVVGRLLGKSCKF